MNTFTNAGFIKRVWHNRDYSIYFMDLQTEFTQYAVDLNLSVVLMTMLVDKNQNEHDRQLDLVHLQQLKSMEEDERVGWSSSLIISGQPLVIKSNKLDLLV